MHTFAVIADPHYHEIFPDYGFEGVRFDGRAGACVRTRADSAASTRIFNESYFAFPAALDQCVAEGIKTVVIAGDLTDDGQVATMDCALAVLARYEAEHGLRFFLTPGNHDVYGMSGRHHAKAFYRADGSSAVVASDPEAGDGSHLVPGMFCRSYGDLAPLWARHGIQRREEDVHWECPFGTEDDFAARMFELASPDGSVTHRQLDLSYLVEPEEGLWLVSIDANVFEPRNGRPDNSRPDAFEDSTDAGWNALVRLKPFILDWLTDVSARARALCKTLVCFSHYPAVDTYDGTYALESRLFGATQGVRRTPHVETGVALAQTGIGVHFSGHLHISDTSHLSGPTHGLTNIAVPSPVAFPPAFAVVDANPEGVDVAHRSIEFERFDAFFAYYRMDKPDCAWTDAGSYGAFLYGHVRELVAHRYLPKEWPADLAGVLGSVSVEDLFVLGQTQAPVSASDYTPPGRAADELSGIDLVTDWYAWRKASGLAARFVPADRMAIYRRLIALYKAHHWDDPDCLQARLKLFFEMMDRYMGAARHTRAAAE